MSTKELHPLGEIISEAIENSGIKQATIAKRMGVSRQTINKVALRKTFDLEFLQKLKNASGLDFTNHVFDPKRKTYVNIDSLTKANEPDLSQSYNSNSLELSLTIKIKSDETSLKNLSEMILNFKKEAINKGFQVA